MTRSKRTASSSGVPAAPPVQPTPWSVGGVFALLFVVTLVAYLPALNGDLLWDDLGHVTPPLLQSWSGLRRIWFEVGTTQQYYPLLHSAFWIEHRMWGDATVGYHLINVFWHAVSACLLVAILRRLAIPGALFAGLVFALHPVCVESVAWISEQKNTLSTVFYFASALSWFRFADDRRPARYVSATLLFVAALLTKSVTATLPAALLVVAWWRHGTLSWRRDVAPLLPWFALSSAAGLATTWFERTQIGATGESFTLSAVERGLLASRVVWFYLGKLIWPTGLAFFYPHWKIDATVAWQWLFPVATAATFVLLVRIQKRSRAPLAAALLFGGSLFPALGFVNVYPFVFSYVADHFQYLALIGVIAAVSAGATLRFACSTWPRWSGPAAAVVVLITLGVLTWRQAGSYHDLFTLYETTLERNPDSWVAHLNFGVALEDVGQSEESLPHLQRANELRPNFPETLNSLGNVLSRLGRSREALPYLERALEIQPRFAGAHNSLGVALMASGRPDDGMTEFKRAIELDPKLALAHINLGWASANQGKIADALAQFEQAHLLQPDSPELESKWGIALALSDRMAEAVPHLRRAAELQPENPELRFALGQALMEIGQRSEAITQLEETLRLNPNHANARQALEMIRRPASPPR